jgi:hypothetical protein
MEFFSLKNISIKSKIALLKALDYKSDGVFVLNKDKSKVIDRYTKEPVKINNMAILPGSTIIIDDNPVSIASYLEEYGDVINE